MKPAITARRSARLLTTTALVPVITAFAAVSLIALPDAALAQSLTRGGGGADAPDRSGGGAGGQSSIAINGTGEAGADATDFGAGGGGGGAGVTGGQGGSNPNLTFGGNGGAGGTPGNPDGQDGTSALDLFFGGGGGGGGAHGFFDADGGVITLPSSIIGGRGGRGGSTERLGSGGGGGSGGYGAVLIATGGQQVTALAGTTISGGNGGMGGTTFTIDEIQSPQFGGAGGDGGIGLLARSGTVTFESGVLVTGGNGGNGGISFLRPEFTGRGAAGGTGVDLLGVTLNNNGIIRGGDGGAGSVAGAGGVGLFGSDVAINNTGTIAGGLSGSGAQALALRLSGTNTITNIGTLIGGVEITSGTTSFDLATNQTLGNVVSGAGAIAKTGGGALTLTGANTYSGGTTIREGTLLIGSPGALGTGAITLEGGSLNRLLGGLTGFTISNALNIRGDDGNRLITPSVRTFTFTGPIDIDGTLRLAADIGGSITIQTNDLNLTPTSRLIVESGSASVGTDAPDGMLKLLREAALVQVDGTLNLTSRNATIGNLEGSGTIQNNDHTTTVGGGNFAGRFTGNQALVSTGNLTLSGESTYIGQTLINAGTLTAASNSALGSTVGDTIVADGATLALQGGVVLAEAITINGSGVGSGGAIRSLSASNNLTGAITLGSAARINSDVGFLEIFGPISGDAHDLTIGGSGSLRLSGAISLGSGRLIVDGPFSSILSGANADIGELVVQSGVMQLGFLTDAANGALGDFVPVTMNGGTLLVGTTETIGSLAGAANSQVIGFGDSTLTLGGNDASTLFAGRINGELSLTKIGTGTLTLSGDNVYSGVTTISAGTLQIGNGGTTGRLISDGVVNNSALVFNRSNDLTVDTVISGTGTLTKTGGGTLTLAGSNTYSGGTAITGGTLAITGPAALGSGSVVFSGPSSRLLADFDGAIANDLTVSEFSHATIAAATGRTVTLSGFSQLSNQSSVTFGSPTAGGTIVLAPTGRITNVSAGVNLAGGTLRIGNSEGANVFGLAGFPLIVEGVDIGATGGTSIAAGATLDLGGFGAILHRLRGAGTITNSGAATSVALFDDVQFNGTFDVTGATITLEPFGGRPAGLAGTSTLTKTGSGTLVLGGTNTYSGITTINGGTLQIGIGGTNGTLGSGEVINNAALVFNRAGALNVANTISGTGTLTKQGVGTVVLSGANTFSGGTALLSGTLGVGSNTALGTGSIITNAGSTLQMGIEVSPGVSAGPITLANNIELSGNTNLNLIAATGGVNSFNGVYTSTGTTATLNGTISGNGGLFVIGAGILALNGANQYRGGTNVLQALVEVGNSEAFGTGNVTLGSTAGLRNFSGSTLTLANTITVSGIGVTMGGSNDLVLNGNLSGNGDLFKVQGNTLAINGTANDFGGLLTVNGGTVLVGGNLNNTNARVQVNSGGTLGGTGTIAGAVRIGNGGTLSPGQSPGTLTMGSLALDAGSTSVFELGAVGSADNDLIRVTGNLALNGGRINVVQTTGFGSGQYTLFEFGSLSGALGNMALDPLGGGFVGNLALGASTVLLNTASSGELVWWNGAATSPTGMVEGGEGTWSLGGANFTNANGNVSGPWAGNGALAVFGGAGGLVTIAPGAVLAPTGLNFVADGYVIAGGDAASGLALDGPTGIDTATGVGATIAATISGAGSLTKTGDGTLTLTGDNTYTGLTSVLGGTLTSSGALAGDVLTAASFVNSGTVAGSVTVNSGGSIANAGSIAGTLGNNGTATNTGSIAGAVTNAGTLTSTGTLGGGLVNTAGATAQIAGAVTGALGNDGALTLTGATSGIGAVTQGASGVFDLGGNSTAIGSLAGAGSVLLGAATLTTGSDDTSTSFTGVIAGSGGLTKVGEGTLTLTGANTFTGTTTISGGALQLGDGGTSGAIGSGAIVNNGALVINRSNAVLLGNAISGSGMLVQDGSGTTTLTGTTSHTGGTLVNRGRLVGDTGSLQGAIQNNAALEFAMAANGTFAGTLAGSGLVEKTGAGVLTFAGNGSGLTGPFAVLGGGLNLDGPNGGRLDRAVVTLAASTRLTGNGLVGGLMVQSGAVVAPGNSLGTIGVAGDVTFVAGSRLIAEVSDLGADLIAATGTARLAGALDIVNIGAANAFGFNRAFSLIAADGGLNGSFDAVSFDGFSPIYRPTLRSGATGLELVLAPNSLAMLAATGAQGSALTGNEAAVAARFDAAVAAGFNPQAFFDVYNLAPAQLAGALGQLSGEVHPAMGRAAMRQSRLPREAVLERAAGVALADNPQGNSWGSWGKLMRSWGDVSGEGAGRSGAAAQQTDTEGFVIGFDGGTANDTRALRFGVYGSYLNTRIAIDALRSSGQIEQAGGGVYASLALGGFSMVAGGGGARFDILTNRTIALPGLADGTSTASAGDMAQVFGRMGYSFDLGTASLEPYVAGDAAWIALNQTTERGGAAALSVGRQEYKVAGATAGLAAKLPLGKLRLESDLAARFELGDRAPEALIALAAAPGQATRIASTRLAGTAFAGRLGAVLPLARRIEVRVDYSGEFSSTDTEHAAQAGLSIRF